MKVNYSKGTSWQDVENLLCKLEKSDEELERILPWFYEHVKCFKQVKEGLLILATSHNTDGSSKYVKINYIKNEYTARNERVAQVSCRFVALRL